MNRVDALLVDDEPELCWALRQALAEEPLAVEEAHSAAEARAVLGRAGGSPRCVLLDARLPDGDGLALAREIARAADPPRVFVLSGYYFEFDAIVRESVETGVIAGFFGKPVSIAAVREAVIRACVPRRTLGANDAPHSAGGPASSPSDGEVSSP